jgi:hypothetical protein
MAPLMKERMLMHLIIAMEDHLPLV